VRRTEGAVVGAVLGAVALAPFVVFAAFPLPIPALPAISRDLGVGIGDLQLLVSGYALGLGALLLTGGVLADRYGASRVWIGSMLGYTALSAVCALAGSAPLLVGARIGQGAAGAGLLASSLALVATGLPPRRRPSAMAVWGAAIGAGLAVGPLGGGLSLETGRWRPAFVALAVVAGLAAAAGAVLLPAGAPTRRSRFDVLGAVTLAGGLGALILAISWAGAGRWTSTRVLAGLGTAAVLLAAFAISQRSRQRRPMRADPLVDLRILGNRGYLGGLVAGLALALSALSMMVLLGPYVQVVLGASALDVAVWYLPFSGLAFLVALQAARLGTVVSLRGRLVGGLLLCALGLLALLPISPGWSWPALLPGMILLGLGVGLANPALGAAAVGGIPAHRSGMAAGAANTARQFGNALGIMALGAVLQAAAFGSARAGVAAAAGGTETPGLLDRLAAGDLPSALATGADPATVVQLYGAAQTHGIRLTIAVAAGLALLGAAGTAILTRPGRAAPLPRTARPLVRSTP
jgi:MFS family permease